MAASGFSNDALNCTNSIFSHSASLPLFVKSSLYWSRAVRPCWSANGIGLLLHIWMTDPTDQISSVTRSSFEPTTQKSTIHVVAVQGIAVLAPTVLLFAFHGLRDCALSWNTSHSSCGALGTWELCGAVGSEYHCACCHTLLSSFP